MCLTCGCGEYQRRHRPTDIILGDLAMAAVGQRIQVHEAAANLEDASRSIVRDDDKSPIISQ
jgi:Arc/MetJ family transcription regulator